MPVTLPKCSIVELNLLEASKSLCTPWDGDSALTILNADLNDLRAFDLKMQQGTYNASKHRSSTSHIKTKSLYQREKTLVHIKRNQPVNPLEENNCCLL
jgi:hypothetical protein